MLSTAAAAYIRPDPNPILCIGGRGLFVWLDEFGTACVLVYIYIIIIIIYTYIYMTAPPRANHEFAGPAHLLFLLLLRLLLLS